MPYSTYQRLLDQQTSAGGPSDRLTALRLKPGTTEPQLDPAGPAETAPLAETPPPPQPEDVVDVSAALTRRAQLPRGARPGKLDRLLPWRVELERRERGEKDPPVDMDTEEECEDEGEKKGKRREELTEAERRLALLTVYPCYSRACREGWACYSPSCLQAVSCGGGMGGGGGL